MVLKLENGGGLDKIASEQRDQVRKHFRKRSEIWLQIKE